MDAGGVGAAGCGDRNLAFGAMGWGYPRPPTDCVCWSTVVGARTHTLCEWGATRDRNLAFGEREGVGAAGSSSAKVSRTCAACGTMRHEHGQHRKPSRRR